MQFISLLCSDEKSGELSKKGVKKSLVEESRERGKKRYSLRNSKQLNYRETEVRDEDEFICESSILSTVLQFYFLNFVF